MRTFRCGVIGLLLMVAACEIHGVPDAPAAPVSAHTLKLRDAVMHRRVITFTYKNHRRTVDPHALGTATEGKPALLAWQSAGESSTEAPPGWRVFLVEEIQELKVGDTQFTRRNDYHEGKSRGLKTVELEAPARDTGQP